MAMEPNSDALLVRSAKADREAFGELYERYVNKIYHYVYYRTGNVHDAEDLTARVFQRALVHLVDYDDRGLPFSAWLYRIAHNLVANWHRDRGRQRVVPLEDFVASLRAEAPDVLAESLEEQREMLGAIRRLPDDRQMLLVLKFIDRMSNAEIGQAMGRTEGAVKSLYHRTLLALRDEMSAKSRSNGQDHEAVGRLLWVEEQAER